MNDQDRAAQVWARIWGAFIDATRETKNDFEGDKAAMKEIIAYGQEQFRAGRVGGYKDGYRDAVKKLIRFMKEVTEVDEAANLLAEQEKK